MAESDLLVANTPLFLLRKLRTNQTVAEIAQFSRGSLVLSALKEALKQEPKTLRKTVLPYVYLVALSMMPESSFLQSAAKFKSPHHDWYSYLVEALIQSYRPATIKTIEIPTKLLNV